MRIEWNWPQHRALLGIYFLSLSPHRLIYLFLLSDWNGDLDCWDQVLTTSPFLLVFPLKDMTRLAVLTDNCLGSAVFDAKEEGGLVN